MIRLLWIVAGFLGGIATARNAEPMNAPATAAVVLCFLVGCGFMWFAGYRGKKGAVATAVATAISQANANADARAQAVANSAINLYLGQQAGISPELLGTIVDQSVIDNRSSTVEFDHDDSAVKESA